MAITNVVNNVVRAGENPHAKLREMGATDQAAKELASKMMALDALSIAAWDMGPLLWAISKETRDDGDHWWVTGHDNLTVIHLSYHER